MRHDPVEILRERFAAAIAEAFPEHAGADPLIAVSKNRDFGDYQSNAAMPLGKALGRKPRDIATAIVEHLDVGDLAEPVGPDSIAGPGFINVRLRADALAGLLTGLDTDELGVEQIGAGRTVVVDLCGVNLAKQMHVGHLRATVIGDTLARVLARLGYNTVRQNHVGDWGLPIAMVAERLARESEAGAIDLDALTLDTLNDLYRDAQMECKADHRGLAAARRWRHPKAIAELEAQVAGAEEATARAKAMLVRLQSHDEAAFAIWKRISDVTMRACLATCARLHTIVTEEHSAGESSYAEELAGVVDDLIGRGVAEKDDGAIVVRNEGIEEPTIVRKRDGGFLYATTDVAGIRRRVQEFGADRLVYCVDVRQSLHFKQVFASATKAGYATLPDGRTASLEHAGFGTVLGEDNKPLKTRSGENVRLSDLIDEAITRARAAVDARAAEGGGEPFTDAERTTIAEAVGIAAIKFADLSNDRVRDYVFSFDRMVSFEGATGPYLLYALVRPRKILAKATDEHGIDRDTVARAALALGAVQEKDLALQLLRYPAVVRAVAESLEPHRLCQYLLDLAGAFSTFYDACPALRADDEATRMSRLRLCWMTERVLSDGLGLLGIPTLDRM